MSLIFLLLKAARVIDYPNDYAVLFVLIDLDALVLLRLIWTIRKWQ